MELIIILGINMLTNVLKKRIMPKYGKLGVEVTVFAIAAIITGVQFLSESNPTVREFLSNMTIYATGAIALYQLIIKRMEKAIANPLA